jgi:hypothetical protein
MLHRGSCIDEGGLLSSNPENFNTYFKYTQRQWALLGSGAAHAGPISYTGNKFNVRFHDAPVKSIAFQQARISCFISGKMRRKI